MATRAIIKENIGGLAVIQAVYAFAMALGLTEVFVGSRSFLNSSIGGLERSFGGTDFLILALLINVMLLGLRFFWVPRNLRGLIFTAVKYGRAPGEERKIPLSNNVITFHLVMILLHGSMFYFLCVEFEHIAFIASGSTPIGFAQLSGYAFMHISLLLLNAGWIAIVQRQVEAIRKDAPDPATNASASAGGVWWRNNLVCGAIAIAPISIVTTCGLSGENCLAAVNAGQPLVVNALPLSIENAYVAIIAFSEPLLRAFDANLTLLWISLGVLIANSLIDLSNTGATYLLLEEVEWKDTPTTPNGGAA